MPLKQFQQSLMKAVYGPEAETRRTQVKCIDCGQPAIPNCTTEAGMREVAISGLCEICYDKIFEEE